MAHWRVKIINQRKKAKEKKEIWKKKLEILLGGWEQWPKKRVLNVTQIPVSIVNSNDAVFKHSFLWGGFEFSIEPA